MSNTTIISPYSSVQDGWDDDIAEHCKFGYDFCETLFNLDKYYVYTKPQDFLYSQRRIEAFRKIGLIRNYYLRNPIRFIDDFFNIELLDYQAYTIARSWTTPNVVDLWSRGAGKSTTCDLFIMARQMLSQVWAYIASGTGSQAEQTFTTLEKLANDAIDSMVGSTGKIFKSEVVIGNAAGDGFSHSSNGFSYTLNDGSFTKTLNSNVNAKRGARGNLVLFDECGWLDSELLEVYKAFTIVDRDFKTGKVDGKRLDQVRLMSLPRALPNQLVYISSASSTDTELYRLYRDFSKQMLIGNPDYFVSHIDCSVLFKPTLRGAPTSPLLTKDKVDSAMRANAEKARREYYCQFSTDIGARGIIRRAAIVRNEEVRKPLWHNDTGDKKFIITYDPARSRDNSVISVFEVYDFTMASGKKEKRARYVCCIPLIDIGKKEKTPMQTPDQVEYLKKIILAFNGEAENYGNILGVYIDAGSGGAGVNIADYLMPDWVSADGVTHRGLIDKEYSADYIKKFPNAVDKVRLISPSLLKSTIYDATIELINQDKISFTASYDNRGYLTVFDVDEKAIAEKRAEMSEKLRKLKLPEDEFEERINEELDKLQSVKTKTLKLDFYDELALTNIDICKEEFCSMIRKPRENGKDSFELAPEKANTMHDDRAYTLALGGYGLMLERRQSLVKQTKKPSDESLIDKIKIRKAVIAH